MTKMGQKLTKEQRFQKKVSYIIKRRKTPRRSQKRSNLCHSRSRTLSLPKLIKQADAVFSVWIRNRDRICVLCGKITDLQNGHFIKRAKKYVRWDEQNCNTLCNGCNRLDNYEHDHYVVWFIGKYGINAYRSLIEKSKIQVTNTWIRQKAQEVIDRYGKEMDKEKMG